MSPRTPKLRPVDGEAEDGPTEEGEASGPANRMRLTADRIIVRIPDDSERKSKGGLLIPATAATPVKRCIWSDVVLVGPETRNVRVGDQILFIPHSGLEVEWNGETFLLLRERDVQAVASERTDPRPGQYL
jgi:chaperonin GroES